jgi:hypothetical protein
VQSFGELRHADVHLCGRSTQGIDRFGLPRGASTLVAGGQLGQLSTRFFPKRRAQSSSNEVVEHDPPGADAVGPDQVVLQAVPLLAVVVLDGSDQGQHDQLGQKLAVPEKVIEERDV